MSGNSSKYRNPVAKLARTALRCLYSALEEKTYMYLEILISWNIYSGSTRWLYPRSKVTLSNQHEQLFQGSSVEVRRWDVMLFLPWSRNPGWSDSISTPASKVLLATRSSSPTSLGNQGTTRLSSIFIPLIPTNDMVKQGNRTHGRHQMTHWLKTAIHNNWRRKF